MRRVVAICLVWTTLFSGCVSERSENRGRLRLEFGHSAVSNAGGVTVYAFDRGEGLLSRVIRVGGGDVERGWADVSLPPGDYMLACWATGGDEEFRRGYRGVHMIDSSNGSFSDAEVGVTSVNDFRLALLCDDDGGAKGFLRPRVSRFDDLSFAMVESAVVEDCGTTTVPLEFVRNTSVIKVRIAGANLLMTGGTTRGGETLPQVYVTAPHERYMYDNRLDPLSRVVRFELPLLSPKPGVVEADIKVQRLEIGTRSAERVLLHVHDPSTGTDLVEPVDVVRAILDARDASGHHPWQTQEEIDAQYEFFVTIDIVRLGVTVKINGFEVVDTDVELKER